MQKKTTFLHFYYPLFDNMSRFTVSYNLCLNHHFTNQ